MRVLILGRRAAVVASLGLLAAWLSWGAVRADSIGPIDFESYASGSPNGQDGWVATGSDGSGCATYDHAIASSLGVVGFGTQSLRMSNAVTSGCFGDQTFSKPAVNEAGEPGALNNGMSGGVRQPEFEAEWDFASTVPGAEQPGLSVVASPDRGDGARMSWIQMTDTLCGLEVNFFEVRGRRNPANFVSRPVAKCLDRTVPHHIKIAIEFESGPSNDEVTVYVDGRRRINNGTTWENYYRFDPESQAEGIGSRTVDSLLFRTGGGAAPATLGKGFLIDNVSIRTSGADDDCEDSDDSDLRSSDDDCDEDDD